MPSIYKNSHYSQALSHFSTNNETEQVSETQYHTALGLSMFSQLGDVEESGNSVSCHHNSTFSDLIQPNPKKLLKCPQSTPIKMQRDEKHSFIKEQQTSFNRIEQVVHELVLGRYEKRYSNFMKKIRKSRFIVEKIKYMRGMADIRKMFSDSFLKNLTKKVDKSNLEDRSKPIKEANVLALEESAEVIKDKVGQETVGTDILLDKFTFRKLNKHKLVDNHEEINSPVTYKGFLYIGTGHIHHESVWNRRWCILQDTKIEYYKTQFDEESHCPMGVIHLQHCKISDENIITYLGNSIFCVFLDNNSDAKRIYISADSPLEFVESVIDV